MSKTKVFIEATDTEPAHVRVCAEMCPTCIFRKPRRPTTPCIEWAGATSSGYGVRRVRGKNVRVHRLVWEEANGSIPPDKIVMHLCDNPPCYRLDHLTLGTHKTNSDDKWLKGRGNPLRGEAAGRARLTEEQVYDILVRLDQGQSQRGIAKVFGVSAGAVEHIALGRNWKHIVVPELGSRMRLQPGRVDAMVRTAVTNGGSIPCHETLDLDQQACCRGFFDNHAHRTIVWRLAVAMGIIRYV